MAILTLKGMNGILRHIMESGGLTADMEQDIQRLRDDFDEREGILRKYGEVYDGEDKEEYDFKGRDTTEDSEYWKGQYNDMKKKYLDRFFGGEENRREVVDVLDETIEDVKRDGEIQSFDELLERVEG